ncbi:MAG: DNA recombination protein RmuC [Deltaproteobacteria bacterium]|nr:DNA recombination protein RmuC [Deltaproteobacteria bacterium]MBW1947178.1 DNA recombination protein RmuC [Deltaproteobacteria bacterium]MBW1967462.1 DNA recombination protein RmuC [Deltaproteobacteria bacterium]MBW2098523.1 DNA recombination protein RmuC [Deltaproteobacteria bacterium]
MTYFLCILGGLAVGGLVAWLLASARVARSLTTRIEDLAQRANTAEGLASGLEATIVELRAQNQKAAEDLAKLREELAGENSARVKAETQLAETRQRLEEEKKLLEDAKAKLTDTFKALAGDTLNTSTTAFLNLAKETLDKVLADARGDIGKRQEAIQGLVKPVAESLAKFEEHVRAIEKDRQEAYSGLTEQLKGLSTSQQQLQKETANLVTALRKPQVRGRWGEMTLRRVVELAGMSGHCDFTEQMTASAEDGRLRPDLVVRLPAGREIVVDAKVSLEAYLDAVAAESEDDRKTALARHAAQVRSHMNALSNKQYWTQFTKAPEFVVMFIPGESFFGAAVDADHSLIEDGLEKHVVLATPTTLIALLRAVAYGWRQEQIAKNAREISDLGKQIYERMRTMTEHIADIGKGLEKANAAYNSAVGSMEARVLPAARRFKDLGSATGNDITALSPIETTPRTLTAPEVKEDKE